MDLRVHAGDRLASRLLNHWLETSGDYDALSLMPLYSVYRALVRAWVVCLKAKSAPQEERASATRGATRYIDFARAVAQRPDPVLLLCHGYSGSGKSVASRALADLCGAVRVSSDTEPSARQGLSAPSTGTSPYLTRRKRDMRPTRAFLAARRTCFKPAIA